MAVGRGLVLGALACALAVEEIDPLGPSTVAKTR